MSLSSGGLEAVDGLTGSDRDEHVEVETHAVIVESISPSPTKAEAAAIEIALREVWPKPQKAGKIAERWRFSGRSWSQRAKRFRP